MVADPWGRHREHPLASRGIGVKAIEELKGGWAERGPSHVIEDDPPPRGATT